MLHTVNKSPFEKNSVRTCLRLAREGSDILFIENAVYAALRGTEIGGEIERAAKKHKIFVLGPDVLARGLEQENLIDGIEIVDYDGFVELTVKNDKVQSWL
jgi:tRNA 2-thiouridine synthesizing protein B